MKYLIILFSLITFSLFGQSGIEPTSLQGTPYQGGILVGVTPIVDEFTGDTIYLYQHSDTSFVKIDSLVYTDSLRLYTSQGVFTTYVSGGGGLSGSGVATRVAFWNGTSSLSSNANLYWDDSNNRLGIGTVTPSKTLGINGHISAGDASSNLFIGLNTPNSGGSNNLALGNSSLFSHTLSERNFALGTSSLYNCTSCFSNVAIGFESLLNSTNNATVAIGDQAAKFNTNHNGGTYLGFQAANNGQGIYNVAVGRESFKNGSGNYSVALGYKSGLIATGNSIYIGNEAGSLDSNSDVLYIANSSGTTNGIFGNFANGRFGINQAPSSLTHTLDVNGEVRIRDLTTTTPTKIMANDNDGVLSSVGLGTGINISGGNIVNTGVITEVDGDVDNEIQQIQKSGSNDVNIQITGGAGVGVESTLTNVLVPSNGSNGQILIKGSGTNYSWGDEIGDISSVTVSAPIVGGGVSGGVNIAIDTTSSTGVATQSDLTLKQDQLVSGINIKTVNSNSLLGSGNVSVGTVTSVGATAGTGISITGTSPITSSGSFTVTNTAPDQVVSITGAGSTSVTGTYPSFTVTGASIPQTWLDVSGDVLSWGTTGTFGVGKNVSIGANPPTRDFDVNGDVRLRGAIYNSANSAGTSGQVLTSQGAGAWTWATPTLTEVDGSITNEGYQGVTAGSATSSVIQGYNSSGNATGTGTTINAAGSISISETTSTNGGQITLTGDYGAFAFGVVGNTTVIPVDGSGTAQIQAGTNITATNSGGIVTINSTAGATNLGLSGTGTVALTSSTGSDVNIAQGVGISLTSTGTTMTIKKSAPYTLMGASSISQALTTTYTKLAIGGSASYNGDGVDITFDNANDEFDINTSGDYHISYKCNCKSSTASVAVIFDLIDNVTSGSLGAITSHYFNNTNEYCHNNSEWIYPFVAGNRFSIYAKTASGLTTISDCNIRVFAEKVK